MKFIFKTVILWTYIALLCKCALFLKHHLVLTNDHRIYFSVSSFGYLLGGRLDVIVQNLTINPDDYTDSGPQYGFVLTKSDQTKNLFLIDPGEDSRMSCVLNSPRNFFNHDLITLSLDPDQAKVLVMCSGDNKLPTIGPLPYDPRKIDNQPHSSYMHHYNKRGALTNDSDQLVKTILPYVPETKRVYSNTMLRKCLKSNDLPLIVHTDDKGQRSYAFNFTMIISNHDEEGLYYLTFHNCRGRRGNPYHKAYTPTTFNLSMLIYETNFRENYLSAGVMPLPQMYFVLSVMFFLLGCIWVNFIARQKENTLKIHYLMTVLVFAKASSLLFHGINYHYIALNGQPVVTWAYLYYATRSLKGALFFITLALIGSGWSFIKHILSDKDKRIIMVIVGLQIIAHIAEIVLDESTEGEASNEFWSELSSLVDLFSCVAILYPISWSVRHLEEASRTDGKAAINLKKLELFKRFYIISTIYIYVTRIVTFVFLSMLSYKYSWMHELVYEFATLTYFIITGYYFQPMPTNPYLLLSSENNDMDEDVLFSVDPQDIGDAQMDDLSSKDNDSRNLLDGSIQKKATRRIMEDIV